MMKAMPLALAAAALVIGTVAAQAESSSAKMNQGASEPSPGHQMQDKSGPGASEYAPGRQSENRPTSPNDTPGHQMHNDTGPGASEYAPDHNKEGDTRKE
jgi:hypothetical protein